MKLKNIIWILYAVFLTSCAVSQGARVERKHKKIKRMSNARLYNEVTTNYLDYKTINFKKINISYEQKDKKQEFRGSVRILKDSIIWLSISKMGIEGVRVKLTPDSVFFIDRLHREYMMTDYSYLNKRFNLELDYYLVQSILTNQLPEYRVPEKFSFLRNFKSKKTNMHYLFYSKKRKDKKYWKEQRNITGNEGSTLEVLRITPDLMRLESIDIYDTQFLKPKGQQTVNFNLKYNNYKIFEEKHLFPEEIVATVQRKLLKESASLFEKMILTISINKLEIDTQNLGFPFKISRKYNRIYE